MSTFRRWLIMTCLCLSGGIIYLLPYLREVYYIPLQKALHLSNTQLGVLMSVVFGGALGMGKMLIKPFSALGAGFIADKIGSSKTVAWSFVILIFSFGLFTFTPGNPRLVLILVINTAIAATAIFALRGVYFALLEEGGVPLALTGIATGTFSVIGFTPDIFIPLVAGVLLDGYPGVLGYRYFFIFIVGLCIIGLLAALLILRKVVKKKGKRKIS